VGLDDPGRLGPGSRIVRAADADPFVSLALLGPEIQPQRFAQGPGYGL
jgi:hypothetical protein